MKPDPQPSPELVEVKDLDQFVSLLTAWHAAKLKQARHLLEVPIGGAFEIGEGAEQRTIILDSGNLPAFKLGVELCIMQLGELPFVAQVAEIPEEPQAPAATH